MMQEILTFVQKARYVANSYSASLDLKRIGTIRLSYQIRIFLFLVVAIFGAFFLSIGLTVILASWVSIPWREQNSNSLTWQQILDFPGLQGSSPGWPTLKIYQLYYSEAAWPSLEKAKGNRFFRAMSVVPGMVRKSSNDISAPVLLPILNDTKYQSLLCEYGAIFAVGNDAEKWTAANNDTKSLVPSKWIGFQSWRAEEKSSDLKSEAILKIERMIRHGQIPEDSVLYWGVFPDKRPLFSACERFHGHNCPAIFSQTFKTLFASNETITVTNTSSNSSNPLEIFSTFLPNVPSVNPGLCYFSYFAMSHKNLVEYSRFAKSFFVVLESAHNVHDNDTNCPMPTPGYPPKLCWCFIMERLINIWMFHTMKPVFLVNRLNGKLMTPFLSGERRNASRLFQPDSIASMLENFSSRLSGRSLSLYERLSGA